jgi:uncharacterized protein YggE
MKRVTIVALGVAVLALAGLLLHVNNLAGYQEGAGKEKEPRKLSTSGSATVRIKPNRARLYLAVESTASTIKSVREANKKHVESVIAAIQGLKIAELKMKTTDVRMDPIYAKQDKETTKLPEILGYRITTTFTVLAASDDAKKLAGQAMQVLDTALENGANALQQITFFRDDLTETRRQALTKATADAVANAKALASGDNRTLTDVIDINGNPEYHVPVYTNAAQPQEPAGGSTVLVAGDVEVTCRVSITCTYGAAK